MRRATAASDRLKAVVGDILRRAQDVDAVRSSVTVEEVLPPHPGAGPGVSDDADPP
jgi:hypothetical protein